MPVYSLTQPICYGRVLISKDPHGPYFFLDPMGNPIHLNGSISLKWQLEDILIDDVEIDFGDTLTKIYELTI